MLNPTYYMSVDIHCFYFLYLYETQMKKDHKSKNDDLVVGGSISILETYQASFYSNEKKLFVTNIQSEISFDFVWKLGL